MITEKPANTAADRNLKQLGGMRRLGSSLERRPDELSKSNLPSLREALSLTGKPSASKRKADCGELFRSWAFPHG